MTNRNSTWNMLIRVSSESPTVVGEIKSDHVNSSKLQFHNELAQNEHKSRNLFPFLETYIAVSSHGPAPVPPSRPNHPNRPGQPPTILPSHSRLHPLNSIKHAHLPSAGLRGPRPLNLRVLDPISNLRLYASSHRACPNPYIDPRNPHTRPGRCVILPA